MKHRRIIKLVVAIFSLTMLWFAAVDKSWFVEQCYDCGYFDDILEYRVFGVAVHKTSNEYHHATGRVARDLGYPCPHQRPYRWHKHRYWGLLYLSCPNINGIFALRGDTSWYDGAIKAEVKELGVADPNLGEQFFNRVILKKDQPYWFRFKAELCDDNITRVVLRQDELTEDEIRKVVDRIEDIEWIPLKEGESYRELNAAGIFLLGKRAGPYLVEKLTDGRPSKYINFVQFTISNIADHLLCQIYYDGMFDQAPRNQIMHTRGYPERWTAYDYHECFESPDARKELQDA